MVGQQTTPPPRVREVYAPRRPGVAAARELNPSTRTPRCKAAEMSDKKALKLPKEDADDVKPRADADDDDDEDDDEEARPAVARTSA